MNKPARPRTPAALAKPISAPRPIKQPKTAEEAVEQCLAVFEQGRVTLKDGSAVTLEMLPSVVSDILELFVRAQAEAQQLRATLKTLL